MIALEPIGLVENEARSVADVPSEGIPSRVRIFRKYAPAMQGLMVGEHVHIVAFFHQADDATMVASPGSPNAIGSFAIRGSCRPNRIGLTVSRILAAGPDYLDLAWLDFCDQTPVLDVKRYNWRWECILSDPRQDRRHIERQLSVGTLAEVLQRPARNLHGEDCEMIGDVARWAAALVIDHDIWLGSRENRWEVDGSPHALDAVMAIGGVTLGGGRLAYTDGGSPREAERAQVRVRAHDGATYEASFGPMPRV